METIELRLSQEQARVVSVLAQHSGKHTMGIMKEELRKIVNMPISDLLEHLFILQEKEFLKDRILQIGTGGTRARYYKLTEGVEFTAVLKVPKKTE